MKFSLFGSVSQMAVVITVMGLTIIAMAVGFRAVYYAFFKKKDERLKWIVVKSMAQSFVVIVIMQSFSLILDTANQTVFRDRPVSFMSGIDIAPVMFSLIIMGIMLLINQRKYGG